jgi:hypothetical protein
MKYLIYLFVFVSFSAFSQTASTIATGRPGQSIGARVVGTNIFQIQSGLEKSAFKAGSSESNSLNNNNVIRYGIDEKYEVSTVIDFNELDSSDRTLANFQLGGRVSLTEKAKGMIPKLCFQTRIQFTDGAGEPFDETKLASILAATFDLQDYGAFTSNLLLNNISSDDYAFNGYTLNWSKNYSDQLGYFIEFYSNKSNEEWTNFWDAGVGYTVNSDLALDFSFGMDLDSDFDSQFIAAGVSWRKLDFL